MRAAEIARALGNARREGHDWRCDCAMHGGCSLALRDGRSGPFVTCWAGCDCVEVLVELGRRGLIVGRGQGAERSAPAMARSDDRTDVARRIPLALRIWNADRDARGALSRRSRYLHTPTAITRAHRPLAFDGCIR
jgi:hypothetical protein